MGATIKVKTDKKCNIVIEDTTKYYPEGPTPIVPNEYKYSDTVAIDAIYYNKIQKPYYSNITYNTHIKPDKEVQIPVTSDGWFKVVHLILPTVEWFNNELNRTTSSNLDFYNIVYYSDGNKVYKYVNGKQSETTVNEILEINPKGTNILKDSKDFISICFLKKCYINLCQRIFNERGFSKCYNKGNIDNELVYKRDLVQMTINVIKYLTECNQLYEVERMIETIQGCNGLCSSLDISSNTNNCGCSK